jgi:hypothetical protein
MGASSSMGGQITDLFHPALDYGNTAYTQSLNLSMANS